MTDKKRLIVVAGPTASGKSDFAVELALKENGEIISADSRQVYRGLDIGTGKITKAEMKSISHHMLDVVDHGTNFSVADYVRRARPIIEDIFARDKTPIICGGTGQYIDALIYGQEFPKIPPKKELREKLEERTAGELFKELQGKDPARATSIDPHNKVRLIRALEIISDLGYVPALSEPQLIYDTEFYLLKPSRELIRERIGKRLAKRIEAGMLDECRNLLAQGVDPAWLERIGLEYRYMNRFLEGKLTYEEFVQTLKEKICQYAKRQDTWNKKYLPFAKLIEFR
jgi:tRNA dimethylallyltransferase